jgi:glutamine synthetase
MECLFHEKPFAGINGSGKHINFSLGNSTQGNLLLPGDTPHDNAQFLVFCAAVVRAVHKYGGLLRASVASATNDHRLGANEAPPAIISIFLGDQLTDVFEQIVNGGATRSKEKGSLEIGVDTLPALPTDPGDRNRTSPFAFTGNRFEFRAPGSLQSIAGPMVTINTVLAESIDHLATELETLVSRGTELNAAVQSVLQTTMKEHGAVVFNHDGYAAEWQVEAADRLLPNLKTTLDALPELITGESLDLFSRYGVFSHREMHSRYEIALEQYTLLIQVEAALTLEMARTIVLPAALRYQTELAVNVASLAAIGHEADSGTLAEVSTAIQALRAGLVTLGSAIDHDETETDEKRAEHAQEELLPAMTSVRMAADVLETLVADDLWPLPTYQEMLFIL